QLFGLRQRRALRGVGVGAQCGADVPLVQKGQFLGQGGRQAAAAQLGRAGRAGHRGQRVGRAAAADGGQHGGGAGGREQEQHPGGRFLNDLEHGVGRSAV